MTPSSFSRLAASSRAAPTYDVSGRAGRPKKSSAPPPKIMKYLRVLDTLLSAAAQTPSPAVPTRWQDGLVSTALNRSNTLGKHHSSMAAAFNLLCLREAHPCLCSHAAGCKRVTAEPMDRCRNDVTKADGCQTSSRCSKAGVERMMSQVWRGARALHDRRSLDIRPAYTFSAVCCPRH